MVIMGTSVSTIGNGSANTDYPIDDTSFETSQREENKEILRELIHGLESLESQHEKSLEEQEKNEKLLEEQETNIKALRRIQVQQTFIDQKVLDEIRAILKHQQKIINFEQRLLADAEEEKKYYKDEHAIAELKSNLKKQKEKYRKKEQEYYAMDDVKTLNGSEFSSTDMADLNYDQDNYVSETENGEKKTNAVHDPVNDDQDDSVPEIETVIDSENGLEPEMHYRIPSEIDIPSQIDRTHKKQRIRSP